MLWRGRDHLGGGKVSEQKGEFTSDKVGETSLKQEASVYFTL